MQKHIWFPMRGAARLWHNSVSVVDFSFMLQVQCQLVRTALLISVSLGPGLAEATSVRKQAFVVAGAGEKNVVGRSLALGNFQTAFFNKWHLNDPRVLGARRTTLVGQNEHRLAT